MPHQIWMVRGTQAYARSSRPRRGEHLRLQGLVGRGGHHLAAPGVENRGRRTRPFVLLWTRPKSAGTAGIGWGMRRPAPLGPWLVVLCLQI